MDVQKHVDWSARLSVKHLLLECCNLGACSLWVSVLSVKVEASHIGSSVSNYNTINIKHRNYLDDEVLSQELGLRIT
jgi:hypothetical protein